MKWPTRCKDCEDANDPVKLHAEIVTLERQRDELQAMSVTKILLDVVPGEDGMGEEVYAKSVADVERAFTKLWDKLEAVEQQRDGLLAAIMELTNGCVYKAYPGDPVPYWHVISMPTSKALDMARAAIAKVTQS